jgi:hypothetical protein
MPEDLEFPFLCYCYYHSKIIGFLRACVWSTSGLSLDRCMCRLTSFHRFLCVFLVRWPVGNLLLMLYELSASLQLAAGISNFWNWCGLSVRKHIRGSFEPLDATKT